ncbi:MAG: HIRAN domain-containing protein [Hyphomicrobiales bacterium]
MARNPFREPSRPATDYRRIQVVGALRYQDDLTEIAGGKQPESQYITTNAEIRREPTNRYDRNAVQVLIATRVVGYLPKEEAARYSPALLRAGLKGLPCPAEIRGGWRTRDGDEGHFGVVVWLPDPATIEAGQ